MTLTAVETSLLQNLTNPDVAYWTALALQTGELLELSKAGKDAEAANKAWFLNKVVDARGRYVRCFAQIREQQFYKAWCDLEQVEIALLWLITNDFYDPTTFGVPALQTDVAQWQSLYPYNVFISPGLFQKRRECSICKQTIDPWSDCGHRRGRVYAGHECYSVVTDAQLVEVSLVLDPVQKYAVPMLSNEDHYDYSLVRFVAERLRSPFDRWEIRWTYAHHPAEMFSELTPEGACPCGSGRSYMRCCASRPGITRPHAHILFEQLPPQELPKAAFAGYGERSGPAAIVSE